MSGVEIIGLLASLSQIVIHGLNITTSISEIYSKVQDAPQRIQQHKGQVGELIEIARFIDRHKLFQDVNLGVYVNTHVNATLSQAKALSIVLDQVQSEYSHGSVRRYWKALKGGKEKEILVNLERLEQEKNALQLCIALFHTELLDNIQGSLDELSQESAAVMPLKKVRESRRAVSCLIGILASEGIRLTRMKDDHHSAEGSSWNPPIQANIGLPRRRDPRITPFGNEAELRGT